MPTAMARRMLPTTKIAHDILAVTFELDSHAPRILAVQVVPCDALAVGVHVQRGSWPARPQAHDAIASGIQVGALGNARVTNLDALEGVILAPEKLDPGMLVTLGRRPFFDYVRRRFVIDEKGRMMVVDPIGVVRAGANRRPKIPAREIL